MRVGVEVNSEIEIFVLPKSITLINPTTCDTAPARVEQGVPWLLGCIGVDRVCTGLNPSENQ